MIPFAELTSKEKAIEILRWIAVLPAAILGGAAAHILAIVFNSPGCTRGMVNPGVYVWDRFFVVLMSNVAMGAATVIAGAKTAPRFRQAIGIVLAVMWVFYSGMVFTILLYRPTHFWDYMAVVVGAIAAAGGAIYIHTEESRKRNQPGAAQPPRGPRTGQAECER